MRWQLASRRCLQQIVCKPGPSEEVQNVENIEREIGTWGQGGHNLSTVAPWLFGSDFHKKICAPGGTQPAAFVEAAEFLDQIAEGVTGAPRYEILSVGRPCPLPVLRFVAITLLYQEPGQLVQYSD
jgi:hypothetical protein